MISFASEGVTWPDRQITWSFADTTLPQDGDAPFTGGLDVAQQAVVRSAIASWAAASGLQIVELPPGSAASADIRIGFGDLNAGAGGVLAGSNAGGQVGDTTWRYTNGALQPDVVIRLQDPAVQPLALNAAGQLSYAGTQTSLYQVALHEFGHALGLAHSADPGAVMNEDVGPGNDALGASDLAGVRWLYPAAAASADTGQAAGPTLALPGGASITFGHIATETAAATLLAPVIAGTAPVTWVELAAADALACPILPDGQSGLLVTDKPGRIALGQDYAGLIYTGAGSLAVSTGAADRQGIVAGDASIAVTAGTGGGTLVAGDGDDDFIAQPGGGAWMLLLGAGHDTVSTAGQDTVTTSYGAAAGSGHAEIFAGSGATLVVSGGQDTVIGGAGAATIYGAGGVLAFGGAGSLTLVETGAPGTLVGGSGEALVFGSAVNGGAVYAGDGQTEFVGGAGRSSIFGGSGALTVFAGSAGDRIVAGAGSSHLYAGVDATITAGAGLSTITGASGSLVTLSGTGSGVVVLGDGAETIDASAASAANVLFAGTGADLILAGAGQDTVFAGSGNATLVGGGHTVFEFMDQATTGSVVIAGFHAGGDHLLLTGFAPGTAEHVLASAQSGGAGLTLALPNGETVLFAGAHTLAPTVFLS